MISLFFQIVPRRGRACAYMCALRAQLCIPLLIITLTLPDMPLLICRFSKAVIQDKLTSWDISFTVQLWAITCSFISYQYDLKPHGCTVRLAKTAKCVSALLGFTKVFWSTFSPLWFIMLSVLPIQKSCFANYRADSLFFFFFVFDIRFIFRVCCYSFGSFDCGFGF